MVITILLTDVCSNSAVECPEKLGGGGGGGRTK